MTPYSGTTTRPPKAEFTRGITFLDSFILLTPFLPSPATFLVTPPLLPPR